MGHATTLPCCAAFKATGGLTADPVVLTCPKFMYQML